MSLSVLENVEIIDITLICLENVENDFIWCRNCRKYLYLFKTITRGVYYCWRGRMVMVVVIRRGKTQIQHLIRRK
jgi:hypothetical protein